MHVVVVGCGRVGSGLARSIEAAGHTVAVVDRQEKAFRRLGAEFAGTTVVGVGFDRDRLEEAGVKEAEALAAVTNGDNSNILVARIARETYGIERVAARIYDPRRAAIYERLGIATIATVQWATERVLRRLLPGEAAVEWIDPSAKVALVERVVPASIVGQQLDVAERDGLARIVAVRRLGVSRLPSPGLVLQEDDVLYVAVDGGRIDDLDAHLATAGKRGS
ncbi:MAG: TrkA family potassium uptake protein [Actinomycetota bacterium]|nr:TrkA family potassium uptake protein [Acidimicrobiia bacterium]MDQ3293138.1 TrkA family potassium uptake protein [Actinomycetota bacterium]